MRILTEELPTPSAKEDIAARIKREVEEYQARGGEIKVIPWGHCAIDYSTPDYNRRRLRDSSD